MIIILNVWNMCVILIIFGRVWLMKIMSKFDLWVYGCIYNNWLVSSNWILK